MSLTRTVLLLLPQVWVASAYHRFHETALGVQSTAAGSMGLGILADTFVVAVGVLVLTMDLVAVVALLRRAGPFGPTSAGTARTGGRSPGQWRPGSRLHAAPRAATRRPPRCRADPMQPIGHVDPRRADRPDRSAEA